MAEGRSEADDPAGAPRPPDAAPVNEAWRAEPVPGRGLRGALERLLLRALGPRFAAQREFNARQVRLDNELVAHLDARLADTHAHYDALLGGVGRRLEDADARHRGLERELVRHVQDLVLRIDVVLLESNRDRQALAGALEDVRARLARLEQSLRREG